MSKADRVTVVTTSFDYLAGEELNDQPTWLGFLGTTSPICAGGAGIYSYDPVAVSISEVSYPQDQFASMAIWDVDGGPVNVDANGAGVLFRAGGSGGAYSYYIVIANGNTNYVYIWRVDSEGAPEAVLMDSFQHTMTRQDEFWCEVVSDGSGGCDIKVYHTTRDGNGDPIIDDQLLRQKYDPIELLGAGIGITLASDGVLPVSIVSVSFGNVETAATRVIHNVNTDHQVYNLGPVQVNGTGFTDVTGAHISDLGNRQYPVNIIYKEPNYLEIEPWDIHDTQLYYATLRLTLTHDGGDFWVNFDMNPSADARWVELSGSDGTMIASDISAVDGDQLEVPASVGDSILRLSADGDVEYDEAVPHGSTHVRWLLDKTDYTWDSGLVTIDQLPDSVVLVADDLDGLNNSVEAKSVTITHVLAKQDLEGRATVSAQSITTPGPAITYSTQIFNNAFFAAPFDFVAGYGTGFFAAVAHLAGGGEIEQGAIGQAHTTLQVEDLNATSTMTTGGVVRSDHQLGSTDLAAGGEIEPTTAIFTSALSALDLTQTNNSIEPATVAVPHVLETTSLTQVNTVEDGLLGQISAFPGEPLDSIGQTQPVTITQSHRVSAATADSTGAVQALSVLTEHVLAAQSVNSTLWISTPNIVGTERAVIGVGSIEPVAIIQTLDPYRYATAMVIGA